MTTARHWLRTRKTLLAIGMTVLAACSDHPTAAAVATTLSVSSGTGQSVVTGAAAATPLQVKVVDQSGAAMSGVTVNFSVASGGGTLSAASATTNSSGIASTTYSAGTTAGTATVTATVAGLSSSTFTITIAARTATTLSASSGNTQTVVAGVAAANPLTVRVIDQTGAGLAGVPVTFAVTAGGGTIGTASATTDASGNASTTFTGGTTVGTATVSATVAGLPVTTFTLTQVARAATTLSVSSGSGQSAVAGAAAANPFVVRVVDQTGAALAGVPVTFAVTSGGGTLSATTATTNATGLAQVNYTAGSVAGSSSVSATVAGLTPVTFATTVTAAPPTSNSIAIVSGNAQSGATGAALTNPFTVRVTDASGNAVSGATVTWTIASGGGALSSATSVTNASGQATTTYTAGAATGTSSITASIAGGGTASFTATVSGNTSGDCASQANTTARVVCFANAFLATLTPAQQVTVQPTFTQTAAIRWSNLPCGLQCRNGLLYSSLTPVQLTAALAVAQAASSSTGYATFDAIRKADTFLSTQGGGGGGGGGYGEGLYIIAFLGTPSTTGTWMLQFGGHHHAANVTFKGGTTATSITPYFVGVEPQSFTLNGTTYAPLEARKTAIYSMIQSLDVAQLAAARLTASFNDVLLGPGQDGRFPTQQGQLVSTLSTAQQALVKTAIEGWVKDAPDDLATLLIAEYTSATAFASTRIAWSGSTAPTVQGSYVRIDGPNVWIEFVCQNGVVLSGIHFHTIYRDKARDYGGSFTF